MPSHAAIPRSSLVKTFMPHFRRDTCRSMAEAMALSRTSIASMQGLVSFAEAGLTVVVP